MNVLFPAGGRCPASLQDDADAQTNTLDRGKIPPQFYHQPHRCMTHDHTCPIAEVVAIGGSHAAVAVAMAMSAAPLSEFPMKILRV